MVFLFIYHSIILIFRFNFYNNLFINHIFHLKDIYFIYNFNFFILFDKFNHLNNFHHHEYIFYYYLCYNSNYFIYLSFNHQFIHLFLFNQ